MTALFCCLLMIPGRTTIDEANARIVDALVQQTGSRDVPRQRSRSPLDWPESSHLIRVQQDDVPILGVPDYTVPTLELVGVASKGEHLALVDWTAVQTRPNLLSRAPDHRGIWYKVRLLEGSEGWILARPYGRQGQPIASSLATRNEDAEWITNSSMTTVETLHPGGAQHALERFAQVIRSAYWMVVFAASTTAVLGISWITRAFWRDRVRRRLNFRRP